ncbi:hypothetical protein ACVWZA_000279 [Sphingomonas sp. UYAg733]
MKTAYLCFALLTTTAIAGPACSADRATGLDPQHQALADLAGSWKVKQSFWTTAETAPKVDAGTAYFSMVLNRRHLRQTLRIADGTNFEGLGYIGYDNASGDYFSTWMDINFPGLVIARGQFDPASKAYVFRGIMTASTPGASAIPVREVMTIIDGNHFKYEYFEVHDGNEALTVRLEYSRAGRRAK